MKTVAEIMTKELFTVGTETTIRELAELFVTHRISSLPVVNTSGTLLGIVTESDLVEQSKSVHLPTVISLFDWVIYLESEKTLEKELKKMGGRTVADIYQAEAVSIASTASLSEAADLMSAHHTNALPVLDNGKLVGIVARIDIIRTLLV
ncbi:MAG: CBS domain-containing protein [Geobacter sp.]|nr:CBS domain-containing protein [Geobacter sp.]